VPPSGRATTFVRDCAQTRYNGRVGRRRTQPSRSAFGRLLERRLTELDLSPADLARRTGLSRSHLYQLLRGDRADPRATTLQRLAEALDLSLTDLSNPLPPTPVDPATFFALLSGFPSGVTVVATLDASGTPRGLTCTATCSVSADPPLLLICVDRRSQTLAALRHSRAFVVNYLLDGRGDLSNQFATRGLDKWADVRWRPTRAGLPVLAADALAYCECTIVREVDGGDHVIFLGLVTGGQAPLPGTQPLTYFRRTYVSWASR
jgi:flavin reductase (DIM6/NTAB) family NADH-FMN oxidoreductase RutF